MDKVLDACAAQLTTGEWLSLEELQAIADQLADAACELRAERLEQPDPIPKDLGDPGC